MSFYIAHVFLLYYFTNTAGGMNVYPSKCQYEASFSLNGRINIYSV